jgi:acyl carrier protein
MVPRVWVLLEKLPLTGNGKVDRRALPEVEGEGGGVEEYEGPRNAEEEIVCGLWGEVLKQERVGIRANFFELGGHSLLATQLVSRIRVALGVELPLRALFEAPTVAGLVERIEEERRQSGGRVLPRLERGSREVAPPLSFAQQRLWFIDQLQPGNTLYNIPMAVRLSGELNREALKWSVGEIVRRHEALRTRFPEREGVAVQEIVEEGWRGVEEIDLRGKEEVEREEEAQRVVEEEAGKGFDLGQGPLLRVKLLQVEEQEHVLVVTMHHIVSDGWSTGVMVREFVSLYEARSQGRPSPLPELEIQYADYAMWQRGWLQGEVLAEQVEYWRGQLQGVEALELPVEHGRGGAASQAGGSEGVVLGEELT